jgi:hypothetical protein
VKNVVNSVYDSLPELGAGGKEGLAAQQEELK